jgi:hypothetical protein
VAQLPKQDFTAVRVRPNAHGNEDRTLETPLDHSFSPFAITTDLTVGSQERDPDGINLQDRRDIGRVAVGRELCQLM